MVSLRAGLRLTSREALRRVRFLSIFRCIIMTRPKAATTGRNSINATTSCCEISSMALWRQRTGKFTCNRTDSVGGNPDLSNTRESVARRDR